MAEGKAPVDVTDTKALRAWLETLPAKARTSFAARAALRSLPVVMDAAGQVTDRFDGPKFTLACFRATLIAGATGTAPTPEISESIRAAAAAAADSGISAAAAATQSVTRSGAHPAAVSTARSAARSAADSTADSAFSAAISATQTANIAYSGVGDTAGQSADSAALLNFLDRPRDLFSLPLWQGAKLPDEANRLWQQFQQAAPGTPWAFWAEWYDSMMCGAPLDWELQRRVALISVYEWKEGPGHIAKLIEEIRARFDLQQRIAELEAELTRASASRFGIGGNNPPDAIDDAPAISKELIVVWEPLQALRSEVEAEVPDMGRIAAATETLRLVLKNCGLWAWGKADRAATAAAIAVGTAGGTAFVAWLTGNGDKVGQVIEAAERWLGLL